MHRGDYARVEDALQHAIDPLAEEQKLDHLRPILDKSIAEEANGEISTVNEQFWTDLSAEVDEMIPKEETLEPDPEVWP
jgi:hypothetical protein